jgi:hypothetical protein
MELDKKALDNLDLEVDPRGPTEEEHLATLAFIAACKDYKTKQEKKLQTKQEKKLQREINKRKRIYEPLVAKLYEQF